MGCCAARRAHAALVCVRACVCARRQTVGGMQQCCEREHTECAAQFAAMFAVDRSGYGTQTLDLQPLGPAQGGGAGGGGVNVQVRLAIAATSDEHADRILQTFL